VLAFSPHDTTHEAPKGKLKTQGDQTTPNGVGIPLLS